MPHTHTNPVAQSHSPTNVINSTSVCVCVCVCVCVRVCVCVHIHSRTLANPLIITIIISTVAWSVATETLGLPSFTFPSLFLPLFFISLSRHPSFDCVTVLLSSLSDHLIAPPAKCQRCPSHRCVCVCVFVWRPSPTLKPFPILRRQVDKHFINNLFRCHDILLTHKKHYRLLLFVFCCFLRVGDVLALL